MDAIDIPEASQERDPDFGPAREMAEADFEAMRAAIRQQALGSVEAIGSVAPALFLPTLGPDGQLARMGLVPVEEMLAHPVGAQVIEAVTDSLLQDPNHDFAILLHEAWALTANSSPQEAMRVANELAAGGGSLADVPGAIEAVVLRMRSKSRQAVCVMAIERAPDGSIASIADEPLVFLDAPGVAQGSPEVAFPDGPPLDATPPPRGARLH